MEQDVSKRSLGRSTGTSMFQVRKSVLILMLTLLALVSVVPSSHSASIANGQLFMGLRKELNGIYSSFTTSCSSQSSETDLAVVPDESDREHDVDGSGGGTGFHRRHLLPPLPPPDLVAEADTVGDDSRKLADTIRSIQEMLKQLSSKDAALPSYKIGTSPIPGLLSDITRLQSRNELHLSRDEDERDLRRLSNVAKRAMWMRMK